MQRPFHDEELFTKKFNHYITMKKIFLLSTVIFIICFAGCGDNTVSTSTSIQKLSISGKIMNWNLGKDKKLLAEANGGDTGWITVTMDSCVIDSAGNFTISLDTPPDSVLMHYNLNDTNCTHHTVINPTGLRFCYMDFTVVDSTHHSLGDVYRSTDTLAEEHTGKINSYIYYFNGSGSVMGTDTCNYGTIWIETSSVTQSKGWNWLYDVYDSVATNLRRLTITTQQQVVQWYLFRHYDASEGKFYPRKYLMKEK